MNIFKVMASGRKSFQEEFSSALLAWLLNPHMEHGLGYSFLEAFITSIFKKVPTDNYKKAISEILDKLKPALRTQKENTITFEIHLEKNVTNAFIDIVVQLDNWWFAIENKIYSESVREKDHQVKTQYIGLRKTIDTEGNNTDHIVSVFLVPNTQSNAVYEEYESLNQSQLKDGDLKTMMTWCSEDENPDSWPSIAQIIRGILAREQNGLIEPLTEYLRHTLKALLVFIENDFEGYEYSTPPRTYGLRPKTELLLFDELIAKTKGYVGVASGVAGLLRHTKSELKNRKFQFLEEGMDEVRNWLDIELFKNITKWLIHDIPVPIVWEGVFSADLLFRIASAYNDKVFIGIRGGSQALQRMSLDNVIGKKWQISTEKRNQQWIEGSRFTHILNEKGFTTK